MGWKTPAVILLFAILMWYGISRMLIPNLISETPDAGNGWWGPGPEVSGSKQDTSVRPFRLNVSDEILSDLNRRLENTRFIDAKYETTFRYGSNPAYMKQVRQHWLKKYSWGDAEKKLNKFDHFLTNIEGIDVHFIHSKPKLAPGQKAKPMMMIHGWPGSFYEFNKMIPMMSDPLNHGGSADDIFEVICPSIPGFGFSEPPHKKGFTSVDAARMFDKLMMRLGFKEYYLQGGDWGAVVAINMAVMFPSHVKGLHSNDVLQVSGMALVYPFVANLWPSFFLPDEREQKSLLPPGERLLFFLEEAGFLYQHATKPDSSAAALQDSPLGMASHLLEKFSGWTNRNWRDLPDGGLTKDWTLDELLTNVMIYWVNNSIGYTLRMFKEDISQFNTNYINTHSTRVPYGQTVTPQDFFGSAAWLMKPFHRGLIHFTYLPKGGHFPAFQVPDLLAKDVREFVRKVEAL
ncbi:epoxide hydrolase 1-like [Diadema antillarum]|uniref:epoxide hydrolase 1-like n=1 Tax=Diadema antillarum TaxID=105358 RepID=UPI003A86B509